MRRKQNHRCVLIGFGRRAVDDFLPGLFPPVHHIELVGVCDRDPSREKVLFDELAKRGIGHTPKFYTTVEELLDKEQPDFAILSTPHDTHFTVAKQVIERGIPLLKEKPFAINYAEGKKFVELVEKHSAYVRLCVQRRHHPLYVYGQRALRHLGNIRHFTARYQLNAKAYHDGWRSSPETSGGGTVIDMGYHLIDELYWYFGTPSQVYAVAAPKKDEHLKYSVEETVLTSFGYENGTVGSLFLSLCEPDKGEELKVYGTHGYVHLRRDALERFDNQDDVIESLSRNPAWPSAVADVLLDFVHNIDNQQVVRDECLHGREVMLIIDSIYRSMKKKVPINPRDVEHD